jgi:hypothetical protein
MPTTAQEIQLNPAASLSGSDWRSRPRRPVGGDCARFRRPNRKGKLQKLPAMGAENRIGQVRLVPQSVET